MDIVVIIEIWFWNGRNCMMDESVEEEIGYWWSNQKKHVRSEGATLDEPN